MSLQCSSRSHIFSSVRRFQMRGAATENALSPIFRLARLTMKLLLLDDRNDGRDAKLLFSLSQGWKL